MAYLIFKTRTIADTLLKEIAVTEHAGVILYATEANPDFGFDGGTAIVGYDEQGNPITQEKPNVVSYVEGADGRCFVAYPFNVEDEAWLEVYLEEYIVSGDVVLAEVLPGDWRNTD